MASNVDQSWSTTNVKSASAWKVIRHVGNVPHVKTLRKQPKIERHEPRNGSARFGSLARGDRPSEPAVGFPARVEAQYWIDHAVKIVGVDNHSLSSQENLAQWREVFEPVFDLAALPERSGAFRGDAELRFFDDLAISFTRSSKISFQRSIETILKNHLSHFLIKLNVSGKLQIETASVNHLVNPGRIALIDLLQPSRSIGPCDKGYLEEVTLWLPRRNAIQPTSNERLLHGMLLRDNPQGFRIMELCLRQIRNGVNRLNMAELSTILTTVRTIVSSEIQHSLALVLDNNSGSAPASFFQVKDFIDRNIKSPKLTVDHICAALRLSRASLYRLFVPVGGIAEYIRKQRLAATLYELTSPQFANNRIRGIAFKWGFTNIGTFCRCFRDEYDMSPSEARAIALGGARSGISEDRRIETSSLGDWLKKTNGR